MLKIGFLFLLYICIITVHTGTAVNSKKPPQPKISSCWNPADGSQISCSSKTSFCQTNMTTGIGSCQTSCSGGSNINCCNSGANCNQFVTSCYDLSSKTFVKCSQTGANKYCQISLPGPFSNPVVQFATASGTCQTSCTPSNLNSASLTFCCFAQDNCNYFPASGK